MVNKEMKFLDNGDIRYEVVDEAARSNIQTINTVLDTKADTSNVTALDTRVTAVESDLAEKADADEIGDLSQLETTAKTDLVSAINEAEADVEQLKADLGNLQGIKWNTGYIKPNGTIVSSDTNRCYSNLLICPPNTQVKYVAETNHNNIAGISFYDIMGTFISGVANNGTMGDEMTVTSPDKCAFCRLSTRVNMQNQSYYTVSDDGVEYIVKKLSAIEAHNLVFRGNGSDRTPYNYDVDNIMRVTVTDSDYEISMVYEKSDGTQASSSWYKFINVSSYGTPVSFRMRRADNGTIPDGTLLDIVDTVRSTDFLTVGSTKDTCYVNKNGNDSNDGLSKSNALLNISTAIEKGFKNILIGGGVYTENIIIDGVNGLHMSPDMSENQFSYPNKTDNPKVVIDGSNTNAIGIQMQNCYGCSFEGIEIKNTISYGWNIDNCSDIKFSDCIVHDIAVGSQAGGGFRITDSNIDFYNCIAYNIGTTTKGVRAVAIDGFNIHGTGTVNLFDCSAWNCEDDGVSHHDACCGTIDGGEWYDCGKGGVASPTHGAKINIKNIYSHDNANGIYAGNDRSDLAKSVLVSGCVCKNNTTDLYVSNNTLNVWNCIFDTQTANGSGGINVIS